MRSKKKLFLAAPFVLTTAAVGCGAAPEPVHDNPGPALPPSSSPDVVDVPRPTATAVTPPAVATGAPTATAAPTSNEPIQPMPKEPGRVEKGADGICRFVFPDPEMPHCPPHAFCNPGPPRDPVRVACPEEKKK